MEALTRSYSATKLSRHGEFYSSSSSTTHQTPFFRLPTPNNKKIYFSSHSISLQFFNFKSIESIPSSSSPSPLTQMSVANGEAVTEATNQLKTVHVKFQLQKECLFGEQFFLVGDDPSIGLWNPASAVPLDWSDEHIWSVELDLPVGRSIQFKFVLKGAAEEFFWQPGPDRILQTLETDNTIVVLEDWENAEVQKISEEPSKDTTANQNIDLNVAENITHLEDVKAMVNESKESITTEKSISYPNEESSANRTLKQQKLSFALKEGSLVAENIYGGNGIVATDKKLGGTQHMDLVGYVREPVLVPGMTQLPNTSTEGVISIRPKINSDLNTSSKTHNVEEPGMPKSYENQEHEKQEVDEIPAQEETTFTTIYNELKEERHNNELEEEHRENESEVRNQLNGDEEQLDCQATVQDALQNDYRWGRKTLSKILTTLGFPLDQT